MTTLWLPYGDDPPAASGLRYAYTDVQMTIDLPERDPAPVPPGPCTRATAPGDPLLARLAACGLPAATLGVRLENESGAHALYLRLGWRELERSSLWER